MCRVSPTTPAIVNQGASCREARQFDAAADGFSPGNIVSAISELMTSTRGRLGTRLPRQLVAGDLRNAHGPEVVRRHDPEVRDDLLSWLRPRPAFDCHLPQVLGSRQRHARRRRRRYRRRARAQALAPAARRTPPALSRIHRSRQRHLHRQHAVGTKPGVHVQQSNERLNQQRRARSGAPPRARLRRRRGCSACDGRGGCQPCRARRRAGHR